MRHFGDNFQQCADLEKYNTGTHIAFKTCGKFNRVATYNYIFSDKWYRKIPSDDLCLRSSIDSGAVDDDDSLGTRILLFDT